MRSIFGRIQSMAENPYTYTRRGRKVAKCRVMKPSGWKGTRTKSRFIGYHKFMPLADRRDLAFRLQREAAR